MKKSENTDEVKALKKALKCEQEKNAKLEAKNEVLKAKHNADMAELKKLKRRKDPEPAHPLAADAKAKPLSAKKKRRCS